MQWFDFIYIMIPAYVANIMPVLVSRIPWDAPVDCGIRLEGKRLLGSHKTWRGLFFGTASAIIVGFLLSLVYWPFAFSWFYWSYLSGFGALFGDLAKSFFKRRIDIKPGRSWFPFDQVDFTVGALLFGSFVFFPGWLWSLFIIVVSLVGHILFNHLGYYLRIKSKKW